MARSSHPNILIVLADQHRFDCIGAYGNADICTPNIDSLAADGVRFDNTFCTFPVCTPSRYSILSGLYVHQHTGSSNHCTLPGSIDTFPKLLRNAGYRTRAVGKMHFTPTYLDAGFDEMTLAEQHGPGRYDDDYHRYLRAKGLCDCLDMTDQIQEYREKAPRGYNESFATWPSNLAEKDYSTTWIGERAIEALESWDDGANLLMVGFIKPHHPFDAPKPWSEMYDPDSLSLLPGWMSECSREDLMVSRGYYPHDEMTEGDIRRIMAQYYASITQIDYHVGKMIEVLKRTGRYDDTLIIYTSDHGEFMGFHHLILKASCMYDPLVKVPLIIRFPGQERRGEISDALVSLADIAPTILAQAGCERGMYMRGNDLALDRSGREFAFAASDSGPEFMVRSRTRKLLLRKPGDSRFYDLERDPLEMNNLYNDQNYRQEIKELTERLLRWSLFESAPPAGVDRQAGVVREIKPKEHEELSACLREQMHLFLEQ